MNKVAVLSALALLGATLSVNSPPAAATDISLESRTYVPARGTDGGDTHVLLYEYLTFAAEQVAVPGLYVRAGGWGRTDLADETYGQKTNSELQYAYLGWRAPVFNAEARVGRLSVTGGVARHEVLDGLLLGTDLPAGFDVTLYGGVPLEVSEESRSEDMIYGGRVSQGFGGMYRIGASYLKEENGGDAVREEAGGDIFLAPVPLVQLSGSSLYNLDQKAWARHDYRLTLGPFAKLVRINATWASTDYTAYFVEPMNHAMLPVGGTKLDRFGGELELFLGRGVTLAGEYAMFRHPTEGDDGSIYGARLDWAGGPTSAGASFRMVNGEADEDKYLQVSAHAATNLGPLRVSLGADHLAFEEEISGEKSSTTGSLGLTYAANAALEFSASGQYGKTPLYDREVKGMLAVVWHFDASTKKGDAK